MKILYSIIIGLTCYSCFPAQELQAEMVNATLIKVEEVKRYPNGRQKVLTWQTEKSVSFVTFESVNTNIPVGTIAKVLIQK